MASERDDRPLLQLGDNLRRYRVEAGYSQDNFALQVGVHRTYVGGVERGEINPSLLKILQFTRFLGVDVCDLLDGVT